MGPQRVRHDWATVTVLKGVKCNISDLSPPSNNGKASSFHLCTLGRMRWRGGIWSKVGRFWSTGSNWEPPALSPETPRSSQGLESAPLTHHFPFLDLLPKMSFQPQSWLSASSLPKRDLLILGRGQSSPTFHLITSFTTSAFRLGLLLLNFPPNQRSLTTHWQQLLCKKVPMNYACWYTVAFKMSGNGQPNPKT